MVNYMANDAYTVWLESQDVEALCRGYLSMKGLDGDFDSWLFEKWKSEEADKADHDYEMMRDRDVGG